ncbi:MAG TPA: GNAT family N-acetyltransferase [Flavobacteriaceae bacterium]|nr:GNAT family N-acetyltransferase [Flavobacteriaceae bacterium]
MDISTKKFTELSLQELYEMLQLRSEVFVVEQNCVYQDIDGKDQKSLHVLGKVNNQIVAYCRIFKSGDYFKYASVGRVVVSPKMRGKNYGHIIFEASVKAIKSFYNEEKIKISAQQYLTKFYNEHNFKQIGDFYLEDGIPHVAMVNF